MQVEYYSLYLHVLKKITMGWVWTIAHFHGTTAMQQRKQASISSLTPDDPFMLTKKSYLLYKHVICKVLPCIRFLNTVQNLFTIRGKKRKKVIFMLPLNSSPHLGIDCISLLTKPIHGFWFKVAMSASSWWRAKFQGCTSVLYSRPTSTQHLLSSSSQLLLLNPIYRDRHVNYSKHQ